MSFANPTKIRLGMSAVLFGRSYRVIGRSVLGAFEDGTLYYWTEFNLESSGGKYATLVFEDYGAGVHWKFFEMFDPQNPISAAEAEQKVVGELFVLDGQSLRVNYLDSSRVYFVEGKVPEGVVVGHRAKYFNADAGDRLIVVSWTGDEVEFYSGTAITVSAVADAFQLGGVARIGFSMMGGRSFAKIPVLPVFVGLSILGILGFLLFAPMRSAWRPPAVVVLAVNPSPLAVGASGSLAGRHFVIERHFLVDIAEVGRRYTRHEYVLFDDDGNHYGLISGPGPNAADWIFCMPTDLPLTPEEAGALAAGQSVQVEQESARITNLFRATIRAAEGSSAPVRQTGDVLYGFAASMKSNLLIARWTPSNITCLKGTLLQDKTVKAAFVPPLEK